jgi:voltage-gated potassium channel
VFKTLGSQVSVLLSERESRKNLGVFIRVMLGVALVLALFAALFMVIMTRVEGREADWISAFYWVLVTMSTLGYGDIVFHSPGGRLFSIVVVLAGFVLLFTVLPYLFLNHLVRPWLQASLRTQAPREVPERLSDHVVITGNDSLVPGLIRRLEGFGIPYVLLEPDPERAVRSSGDGLSVILADVDSTDSYRRAHVERARLVLANEDDVTNTNIVLTVRDVSDSVPVAAIASSEDSVDILELAGATHVLPLRRQLGEQLAGRVNAGHAEVHEIGRVRDLVVGEFPVQNTPLAGKTVRETRLRELLGLSMVGIWENAELREVRPDHLLTEHCMPVVVGTEAQMQELNELLYIYDTNWNPILIIGGGKVGRSATRALRRRGVPVHLIERKPELAERWKDLPDRMFVGDAASRELLEAAGLNEAPAVLLTTNDDATNVYLAVYCRRLNPDLRIVSRVTHRRNIASIRRAGADLVLSYDSLGVETVTALARGRPLVLLGEGVELLEAAIPRSLEGVTLGESGIGARTGLNVVALEAGGEVIQTPSAAQPLPPGSRIIMVGSAEGAERFREIYGEAESAP